MYFKCFLLQGDHNHLFIRQGTGLQGQAVFRTKLTFRPHSTESFTHRKMTLSLADRSQKTSGIKVLSQVGWDPEQNRGQMIKVSLSSSFVPSSGQCVRTARQSMSLSFLPTHCVIFFVMVKVRNLVTCHEDVSEGELYLHAFLTFMEGGGEW